MRETPESPVNEAPSDAAAISVEALSATSKPSMLYRFDCTRIEPEPWANGAGTTRTIARGPEQDGGASWRVSLAELRTAAKFSQFPGFDRAFIVADDGAIDLHFQDGLLHADSGHPVFFSGDLHVWIGQPETPLNVVNVMTRRGSHRASVSVVSDSTSIAPAPIQILICLRGTWSVRCDSTRDVALAPLCGIQIEGGRNDSFVSAQDRQSAQDPQARLLSIAID